MVLKKHDMEWILVLYLNKTKLDVGPFKSYTECRRMGDEYLKYNKQLKNNCIGMAILKESK